MPHRRSKQGKQNQSKRLENYLNVFCYNQNQIYDNKNKLLSFMASVPKERTYGSHLRTQLVRAVSSCFICGYENIGALEVHHIDHNHSNNDWRNVTVICANCHVLIHKGRLDYWDALTQRNLKIRLENKPIKT